MHGKRCGRCLLPVAPVIIVMAAFGGSACAQTWRIEPSLTLESTFTNNVNLLPGDERKADWVNALTPGVRFTEIGAHSRITGNISVPVFLYMRTPHENNYVAPTANINGTFDAADRRFFVDTSVNVQQQYLSPFAAHPSDLTNATQNRYTSQAYRISPYVKGLAGEGIDYELRQSSLWTDANATGITNGRAYTNEVSGRIAREPRPFGWSAEFDRSDTDFTESDNSETFQIARLRGLHQVDPSLQISGSVGYEDNRFFFTHESGVTYGAGARWHLSERTSVDADWEHRFFGSSYHVAGSHRTPLTVWSISASRDITTFPQQLAGFPAGVNIPDFLNTLFLSRFPDPTQRQSAVDQVIRERGLPTTLTSALPVFAEQVTLLESATATLGLLGARNSVFFTAFRLRNQPVEPVAVADLTPLLAQLLNQTQVGANATWTHQLEPRVALTAALEWSRSTSNAQSDAVTRQYAMRAGVSTSLTTLTTVYTGVRYQDFRTDVFSSFREFAVFVGLTHAFH
jgi:uncharacterized protein (PEP-CTERM system associated)